MNVDEFGERKTLLEKYSGRVPRYTSYPPATAFSVADPQRAEDAYTRAKASPGEPLSIYVHLPFCQSMCHYCGCAAIASKTGRRWGPYMEHLTAELAMVRARVGGRPLAQLHWGGGTPSWLPFDQAARFHRALCDAFPVAKDAEQAFEIDPRTMQPSQLSGIRGLGFNRVSFGIQDLTPTVQSAVGRVCPEAHIAQLLAEAHGQGFGSINVDLMYGLPRQETGTFQRTVETVVSWRPSRVALFGYAHVPWMRPHQRLMGEHELPGPRERVRLFATAAAVLEAAGYLHLGLDHFVLPTDELAVARIAGSLCRNFQGYSIRRATDLVGLGMSAIGRVAGTFLANHRKLRNYQSRASLGQIPVERAYTPTRREDAIASAIEAVMCHGRLDLEAAGIEWGGHVGLFGSDVWDRLLPLQEDGVVERCGESIHLTPVGRFVARHVAAALDPMLTTEDLTRERFSRGL